MYRAAASGQGPQSRLTGDAPRRGTSLVPGTRIPPLASLEERGRWVGVWGSLGSGGLRNQEWLAGGLGTSVQGIESASGHLASGTGGLSTFDADAYALRCAYAFGLSIGLDVDRGWTRTDGRTDGRRCPGFVASLPPCLPAPL